MNPEKENNLILAFVNQGYTDVVMHTAVKAGAKGGTVIRGRWVGTELLEQFHGISIQDEKEVLLIACAKRPISPEQIGDLIDSIETELRNASKSEIGSKELGDMALVRLAKLDDVAYVRFASVYKDFQNVEEFAAALEGLR